jgi:hypothetical protein
MTRSLQIGPARAAPALGYDRSMRAWWMVACLGCNQVFDIGETGLVDAAASIEDVCALPLVSKGSDFDKDGIPNEVDKCPLRANAADPDDDGDGVGNACDPAPTTAGDCITLFDDFTQPTSECWEQTGAWVSGCSASGAGWCSPGGDSRLVLAPLFEGRSATVAGEILTTGSTGDQVVSVFLDYSKVGGLTGVSCEVSNFNSNKFCDGVVYWSGGVARGRQEITAMPITDFNPSPVEVQWTPDTTGLTYRCSMAAKTGSTEPLAAEYSDISFGAGALAIRTNDLMFRIDAVFATATGASCTSMN